MAILADGARQLPLRHISIRVPWNDTGWTGCVCRKPIDNTSCLILPRIRETRDDTYETDIAGQSWKDLEETRRYPACISERGSFMAGFDFTRKISHPYSQTSPAHQHLLPTPFRYPRYSASCIPFNWMLIEGAMEKVELLDLDFRPELEKQAHEAMRFTTGWVQTKHNQLVMLDTFFSALQPNRSLCFFYAKRTPLIEDSRRVIIGVGWVTHVGDAVEYQYRQEGPLKSVIWERPIQHSIRPPGFAKGFLFPYHEILEYLKEHPNEDPAQFVAFVPDEHFWSYSFTSEHVTNDGAIASLLSCTKTLEHIERIIVGPWDSVQRWIDQRLNELWRLRGPYPGLGAALTAFGVSQGTLLAYEFEQSLADSETCDPWPFIDKLFRDPDSQPDRFSKYISPSLCRKWNALPSERLRLLQLLSRFELTTDQATRYYVHEDTQRTKLQIDVTDNALLANPYRLYECDRGAVAPIDLPVIDRGLFPDKSIRDNYPLSPPSKVDDATDERRVRAFVVHQLEKAATQGHTLQSRHQIIQEIRELDVQPACPVDGDMMNVAEESFLPILHNVHMADGSAAYQLERLHRMGDIIRRAVNRRLKGKRHQAEIPWRERLDTHINEPILEGDLAEEDARHEKTVALEELFASRIAVLIGPAGTGKTTLLKTLCHEPTVKNGGILLLAPTGKARVRMEEQTKMTGAKTIAQFLLPLDRYNPQTGAYVLSDREPYTGAQTVIIDEASMLTEEQLAAVLDALSGVQRLILVGDHRQLPPIGAGRPFLDIVTHLAPANITATFPRVAQGYAELTIRRRQKGEARDDLLLADWFSGRELDAGADEIWTRIHDDNVSPYLRFVPWNTSEELQEKLLDALVDELELENRENIAKFEESLGGTVFKGYMYFHVGRKGKPGACAKIEDWQILSPVRNYLHGVEAVNRFIQTTFRYKTKEAAHQKWRKIPKPMGREEILYGDKVINLKNQRRKEVWPKENAIQYVANGEIGVAVGQFKGKNVNYKGLPWKLEVEFSSQPGFKYGYGGKDFGEEADPSLELAYALTIHKVQGSEFKLTFFIVPNPCRLLSRELFYTALTRQENRVVILHQGDLHDLKRYSTDVYSDAAQRLTNLFRAPNPVRLEHRFLEDALIHRTRRGDSVRSKSEVIIADLLYSKGIDYQYEAPLVGTDGKKRYPDFTFEDEELGLQIYWEHLGMMYHPTYRKRWEKKEKWYREQGILPYKEGGGPNGTLLTTEDDEQGGIQSDKIEQLLDEVLGD